MRLAAQIIFWSLLGAFGLWLLSVLVRALGWRRTLLTLTGIAAGSAFLYALVVVGFR